MLLAFGVCARCSRRSAPAGPGGRRRDGRRRRQPDDHDLGVQGHGHLDDERGTNMLDTGAHFYDTYECADGKYVSIGSIEPQFYAELLRLTGLEGEELPHRWTARSGRR
jgi:crotonobetainyl-CoA:carnitine CoA-transferase CaiB-like acyl-CoA transferase